MPVKVNVKSAVAIAVWIGNAANAVSAGMRSTPPIPTAPISAPTPKAIGSSHARSSIGLAPSAREAPALDQPRCAALTSSSRSCP